MACNVQRLYCVMLRAYLYFMRKRMLICLKLTQAVSDREQELLHVFTFKGNNDSLLNINKITKRK